MSSNERTPKRPKSPYYVHMVDWLVVSVERNGRLWVNGVEVPEPSRETWNAVADTWIDTLRTISGWLRVEYLPRGKTVKFYTDREMRNEHTRGLE